MGSTMKAALLVEKGRLEMSDIPVPRLLPHQVRVRTTGVGICGTDLHIFGGHANYNYDALGNAIPLSKEPQVLGHEISGVIEEIGTEVRDLTVGDRVLVDQGLNCLSQRIDPLCEYCASGASHQCANYRELGITGAQGGFAEYIGIAAVNAIRVEGEIGNEELPLSEPLGCVLHALELAERAGGRYSLAGERRARHVMILGAGPAGLLFLQLLRNVFGFEGNVFVVDINPLKLELAARFGATALSGSGDDLVREVADRTGGSGIYYMIEASGAGSVFRVMPRVLRRQGTVILYGHGHEGVEMSLLNNLQFLEPHLVSPAGASGGFDPDGRPTTYRRALSYLLQRRVQAAPLITHTCDFRTLPGVFSSEFSRPGYVKAVLLPSGIRP
jgi:L-iditol 2-dehydrogenase